MRDNDVYAFPRSDERAFDGTGLMEGSHGMTLRDWFAGQALAACISRGIEIANFSKPEIAEKAFGTFTAAQAYALADYMLEERSR